MHDCLSRAGSGRGNLIPDEGIPKSIGQILGYHPRTLPGEPGTLQRDTIVSSRNYCLYLRRCFAFDESFISHLRLNGFIFDFINGGRKRKEKRNRDAGGGWGAAKGNLTGKLSGCVCFIKY